MIVHNLYDYACNYIETHNYYEGNVNQKVYSLCCDHILGELSDKQRVYLLAFFKLDIHS
jgi:hypothetical protein